MQFKILRTELLNALNKVSRAVSSKSPLPVLTGILFTLTDDELILTGSNSDISIETVISKDEKILDIITTGSIVLSGHYISEIIRKIEAEYITIETIDGTLTRITGENSEFNLNGLKAIDYPNVDLTATGDCFVLSAYALKTIISQTIFCTSDKETRPILTGVNFQAKDHHLQCVATDSYRLAKKVISIDEDLQFNITIPKSSLSEIAKILEKDENITIYVSDRKVLFILDNLKISTRLIDGAFPDTSRLIPPHFDYCLEVSSREILNAIDRASLLASDNNNIVKLSLSKASIQVTSRSQELGSVEEEIIGDYNGSPLEISFSARYVLDAIRSISQSKVSIHFGGEMKPFIFKAINDDSLIQLVLPVRTY